MIMSREKIAYLIIVIFISGLFLAAGTVAAAPIVLSASTPQITSSSRVATEEELQLAYVEWSSSLHADTYDEGMGANTTCSKCKSPKNWDPENEVQDIALDCYSCKRVPGEPRPELSESELIDQADWQNIGCDICHQPIGDSYAVDISFWDQSSQTYMPVHDTNELCAKCHEGLHGFEVIEEQHASPAHNDWGCTRCHGAHGAPSACTDCHNPQAASGAAEHARHLNVNCTACHDAGKLGIWQEEEPTSKHFSQYITRRFAHTLTSWPSHNLSLSVNCIRCHHPANREVPVLVQEVSCEACHPDGEVLFWCEFFERDVNPNNDPIEEP